MLTVSLLTLLACSEEEAEKVETETTETTDTSETDVDDDTGEDTGDVEDTPETALVRLVHLSPDAPPVDVYANGALAGIDDFSFLDGTGFVELPVGEYSFAVAPADTDFESAVPVTLDVELMPGDVFTAIAHGYLDTSVESNGFAISPFATNISDPTGDNFRVQVVHAAAAGAFAKVDIWNFTDDTNPQPLITDFDYGEEESMELEKGIAYVLAVDVNADAEPEAFFDIPDSLTGFVGVYAVNDGDGNPWLIAHFEDGTTAPIAATPQ